MTSYKYYEILPDATKQFKEARLYYKLTRVKGLSTRFAQSVNEAIKQILKNPGAYAIRYKNIRIAYTTTFPYAIHFITGEKSIIIVAIIHNKKDSIPNISSTVFK